MLPILLAGVLATQPIQDDGFAYRVTLVRAAPGGLLELIDLYRGRATFYDATGEMRPVIIRHSQGDHWDLMLVQPIGDLATYFSETAENRRREAEVATTARASVGKTVFEARLSELVAWQEDTFFAGPPMTEAGPRFRDAGYFHIEMFVALPGARDKLIRQREMENDYLRMIGRQENIVLTRLIGGAWDVMTVGFYRGIKHFAESADIPADRQEVAALAAGFEGSAYIGSYLRSLISRHNDTLGVPVR